MIDGRRGRKEEQAGPNLLVRLLKSIGPGLVKVGISADHVTAAGIIVSAATGFALGKGWFVAGMLLLAVGGLMDTLDGAVAKAGNTTSKRGAFFDSVSDRVADMFVFGGLSWYLAAGPGHDPKMAVLPLAILGVSNTISYERAKAESLGYEAKGGFMERAERLISVGIALLLGLIWHPLFVAALAVLLVLCVATAGQRFVKVWMQASAPPPAVVVPVSAVLRPPVGSIASRAKRPPRVESRWRAWREASQTPERRRQRVATASRARARRREAPLSIRVRRAFSSDNSARVGARSTGSQRSRHVRSERRQQGAAAAFRRRLGSGR